MAATMTRPPATNLRCVVMEVDLLWKTSRDSMVSSGSWPSSGPAEALHAAGEPTPVGAQRDRGQGIGREHVAPVIRHGSLRGGRSRRAARGSRKRAG